MVGLDQRNVLLVASMADYRAAHRRQQAFDQLVRVILRDFAIRLRHALRSLHLMDQQERKQPYRARVILLEGVGQQKEKILNVLNLGNSGRVSTNGGWL